MWYYGICKAIDNCRKSPLWSISWYQLLGEKSSTCDDCIYSRCALLFVFCCVALLSWNISSTCITVILLYVFCCALYTYVSVVQPGAPLQDWRHQCNQGMLTLKALGNGEVASTNQPAGSWVNFPSSCGAELWLKMNLVHSLSVKKSDCMTMGRHLVLWL